MHFVGLLNNDFNDLDGKNRLINFIDGARKDQQNWPDIIKKILKREIILKMIKKLLLSQTLINSASKVEEIVVTYEFLEDKHSLLLYIDKANKRLPKG